jgi:starch-binding outer membrane protein, SusD/RagB family
VAYNGAPPYLKAMFGKENMWSYWYDADGNPATGINGNEKVLILSTVYESRSGFYSNKMMDANLDVVNISLMDRSTILKFAMQR